ncbi:elgicin/penisin family lantibiotic [Paenibacillus sp. MZ04-78.2]|uniref:elgicin/penisin family lantibiotic n=1 Tax=Paenibacillus sp. MZ04-78.2 TaxID=2962034 RepID=UPI0035CAD42C
MFMANNHFDLDVEVRAVSSLNSSLGVTSSCITSQCITSKCITASCITSKCITGRQQCGYTHGLSC